jgi:hypothetical protein
MPLPTGVFLFNRQRRREVFSIDRINLFVLYDPAVFKILLTTTKSGEIVGDFYVLDPPFFPRNQTALKTW